MKLHESLKPDLSLADRVGFNPYYQKMTRDSRGKLAIGASHYFDLASNDYLGLATDLRVKTAMVEATQQYGSSFCGTPIAAGYASILAELETALADLVGLESAVIFPSCYQANTSLFATLADGRDAIIVDHYAHASLIQGITMSGARIKPFLHNNLDHLEKQLAQTSGFRRVYVVTESVFSTEGSISPFDAMVALCGRYNATPVIDDSHGIGVIGKNGRGVLEHLAIHDFEGIYTASLGKALANTGGVIAGKREYIEYLKYSCAGLIYSTALVPASAAGLLASVAIVRNTFPAIGKRMWTNHRNLVSCLVKAGFTLSRGEAPIASVRCGSPERTVTLAKLFFDNCILSTPFIPPSVPPGQGVLRLIVGAKTDETGIVEIERLIRTIAAKADQ
jgi:7-keto-8-aminopelargonate synthetase-like enzyme